MAKRSVPSRPALAYTPEQVRHLRNLGRQIVQMLDAIKVGVSFGFKKEYLQQGRGPAPRRRRKAAA